MDVFSNGVAETDTLAPLCSCDWSKHVVRLEQKHKVFAVCVYICVYLKDELHHLSVHEALDRLPVDLCDQITLTEPGLLGWTTSLHVLREKRISCKHRHNTVMIV